MFAVESADINIIALDTKFYVLDEGSRVGWFNISYLDWPLYPDGSEALIHAWAEQNALP